MGCPICGANCKGRRRGADGMCCSCHKHKARPIRADVLAARDELQPGMRDALDMHLRWFEADKKQIALEEASDAQIKIGMD